MSQTGDDVGQRKPGEPNPDASPFELPPIEGIPFARNSEEARAIRRVIDDADRERAAGSSDRSS